MIRANGIRFDCGDCNESYKFVKKVGNQTCEDCDFYSKCNVYTVQNGKSPCIEVLGNSKYLLKKLNGVPVDHHTPDNTENVVVKMETTKDKTEDMAKSVYCEGSKKNGMGVIRALERHGGINKHYHDGKEDDVLFYIHPTTNVIEVARDGSHMELIRVVFDKINPIKMSGRAKNGGEYFTVYTADGLLKVLPCNDDRCGRSDLYYEVGNYFTDKSVAQKICDDFNVIIIQNRKKLRSQETEM